MRAIRIYFAAALATLLGASSASHAGDPAYGHGEPRH